MEVFKHTKCADSLRFQVGGRVPLHSQKLSTPETRSAIMVESTLAEIHCDEVDAIRMYHSEIMMSTVRVWTGFGIKVTKLYSQP